MNGKVLDEKTGEVTLTCTSCGKTATYLNEEAAYKDGWDFPPYFPFPFVTCPKCPSAPILLGSQQEDEK